jgi:Cu/Ag efflux pump CusA
MSGVRAQVAIKLFGNDLTELRQIANQIAHTITPVTGVTDVQVEKQVLVPQLLIKVNREALKEIWLTSRKSSSRPRNIL